MAVKTSSHNQLQIKIGTRCLAQNVLQQNVISKSEYVLEFWSGNDLLFWHALVPQTVMEVKGKTVRPIVNEVTINWH